MNTKILCLLVIVIGLSTPVAVADQISDALSNPSRSPEDRKTDRTRKPAEFMRFLDIKAGMKVLDVFSGSGYYTEIASLIVGEQGEVDAHNNNAYVNYIGEDKLLQRYKDNRLANVNRIIQEGNQLSLESEKYDRILLVLSFHDLYYVDENNGWPAIDAEVFMKKVWRAMKPGGLIGIIDHDAKSGVDISSAQTLHRIDPQIIRDKMKAWGFSATGESDHLKNSSDPMDIPMWEPEIRGLTNKSVMKFTR